MHVYYLRYYHINVYPVKKIVLQTTRNTLLVDFISNNKKLTLLIISNLSIAARNTAVYVTYLYTKYVVPVLHSTLKNAWLLLDQ